MAPSRFHERWTRNLAVTYRPVNGLRWRGFTGGLVGGIAHEQTFPDECFALPEKALAVFIHLRPQAHVIQGAVELSEPFGALNQHDVAVARTADTLVADRLAWNLDQRRADKRNRGLSPRRRGVERGGHTMPRAAPKNQESRLVIGSASQSRASVSS